MSVSAEKNTYAYEWAVYMGLIAPVYKLESEHPYANNTNEIWTYRHPTEVYGLEITFSESTEFENGCDHLYITDALGTEKEFTGRQLSGASIFLLGDYFELRLTSDYSVSKYGFEITSITECAEPEGPTGHFTDSGSVDMPKLTAGQINQLLSDTAWKMITDPFDEEPQNTPPYKQGKVKQSALDAALARLNALRRIAGLSAVTLNIEKCAEAQYGAVLLTVSDFGHYPPQPADMPDEFYDIALSATSSSNIYGGRAFVDAVDGFMDDSDNSKATPHNSMQREAV